jgi:cytochrome c oxidase assembly protein subunit 15
LPPAVVAYIELAMSSSLTTAGTVPRRHNSRRPVRIWLNLIALMIVAMVVVGGATRLTESGLSITEWQPIHGVIPPLNAAEWEAEFAKYRKIPQYELMNEGMTLEAFKTIFWWEWVHRLLGRLIGVFFFVPLVFFWASGRIDRNLRGPLVAIFILGGLQGAVGWWMVTSGLTERTDVSQYRLAVHLTFACVILAYVVWVARGLAPLPAVRAAAGLRTVAGLIVALVVLQIFVGGLVAGLNAGMTFNTWPLMDGEVIPSGLFLQDPLWRNFFENVATVQFDHRLVAYLLVIVAIFHAVQARGTDYARSAAIVAVLVGAQAAIGIATLLMVVPLHLALIHQFGAAVVIWVAVVHLRRMFAGEDAPTTETAASA